MKATELRIGNWVDHIKVGELQINGKDIVDQHIATVDIFNPISITEEWLKKFGFEVTNGNWIIRANLTYQAQNEIYVWKHGDQWHVGISGGFTLCRIDYVHEIQNFFHCLTKKEFELKG